MCVIKLLEGWGHLTRLITGVRQLLEGMGGDMEELTRVTIEHRLEEVGVARWASTF